MSQSELSIHDQDIERDGNAFEALVRRLRRKLGDGVIPDTPRAWPPRDVSLTRSSLQLRLVATATSHALRLLLAPVRVGSDASVVVANPPSNPPFALGNGGIY